MNKIIIKITYGFHQCGNLEEGMEDDCYTATVGEDGVIEINESQQNKGVGLHFCTINYKNGDALKVFNLDTIKYINNK